ncbi:MAG: Rpn family recombination-promoting nuclease/putative transposase [Lachnospiraceae bacterium]|nr:Rpn family recombination-promoting nuclease/putative transposase [Lachnospiraceae bacterium]
MTKEEQNKGRKAPARGQKDAAEKTLEDYEDVFADVMNVFLFQGRRMVSEKELKPAKKSSGYEGGRALRTQERDAAKLWENSRIRIAFIGLENQTRADRDMPLRTIGYDGAAYRDQLYRVKGKNGTWKENGNPRYPVVTIVLYFGYERHWNEPRSLLEVLGDVPVELRPFVNDYEVHVFEVAWMTDEQLAMLQSDFRIIAEYLVQMRKNREYAPSRLKIVHAREVFALMEAMTNDVRFTQAYEVMEEEREVPEYMCEALDKIENKGIEKGIKSSLLEVLAMRGEVPQELRETILSETDTSVLNKLLRLAVKSESIQEFSEKYDSMRCIMA